MKQLFFFVTLVLLTTSAFAQNWVAKATGCAGTVYGIDYVNSSVIWVSTASGEAALSTDAGLTWKKVTNPGSGAYAIAGLSDKIACVATGPSSGDGKIVRTTDGGTTWTQVYTKSLAWFNFIDNIDANNVWALSDPVGGKFLIVKSTDGGATWAEIANPPAPPASDAFGANDAFYRINKTGWFGVGGTTGVTTTANKVFKSTNVPEGPWTSSATTVQFTGSMAFSSETGNGLVGFWSSGVINKTTDGGATYTALLGSRQDTVYAFDYVPGTANVWVATSAGLYKSTNNGTAWTTETVTGTGSRSYYTVKIFGDINNALIGGDGGVVLKSGNSPILPVELTSFAAAQNGTSVNLNWATATETNNKGFEIERKINDGPFVFLAFKNGFGTSSQIHNYTYSDNVSSINAKTITYRLKQVDFDGTSAYSDAAVVNYTAPVSFNLAQNFPNPFNPSTQISYQVPSDNFVSLKVYNSLGQLVSTLVSQVQVQGSYNQTFDASRLTSGVYYAVLKVGTSSEMTKTIKMSLIK